ncbi:MAG: UDP-N-acetylmuramoyl-L-alanine--D-glutamate ligase [Endomicrobiia bacterium]|nr:UDP-N-acetylmuramoyl-L-alanine--D-glutamate ligase [Endomicrobiia bacterium]
MKIGIMGFGATGAAVADFALASGDEVFVSESRPSSSFEDILKRSGNNIRAEFGGHTKRLLDADLIVKSPGILPDEKILLAAVRRGIPVTGELDFVFSRVPRPSRIVAITGTNGKTTVTSLVGKILKKHNPRTYVCGNIGAPLASVAAGITSRTTVVLEVSSYQLEDARTFRPDVSVILNITPDHLEHHGSFKAYVEAKSRIFKNQLPTDYCVLNRDDAVCAGLSDKTPARAVFFSIRRVLARGAYFKNDVFRLNLDGGREKMRVNLSLPGEHNTSNAVAAFAAARLAGAPLSVIKAAAEDFKGVEHRIEFVASKKGVSYINDSKATNVSSVEVALRSLSDGIWLILGGRDKGSPYSPILPLIRKKVKGIFLIGEAAGKIYEELSGAAPIFKSGTLKAAVVAASKKAVAGDTVLLSPACSSYDQFENFERRGEAFKKIVKGL